ncbi:MAG TPA: cohesin domain-containing protein [Dehalococcoidia bacterium]|nr:cohesin domain-containing protein [Dehalococcoidia bacterium]
MLWYRLLISLLVFVISLTPVAIHPLDAAPPFQIGDQVALRIEAETGEGISGDQVKVAVIAENAAAMAGLQFRLVYDGAVVRAMSVEPGTLPPGTFFQGNPNAGAGRVSIAIASASAFGEANETVTLATITFDLEGAPGSMTDLVLDQVLVADSDAQPLLFTTANAMIAITDTVAHQPSFILHQDPEDGATGVKIDIARRGGPDNGQDQNVLLGSFQVQITYDGSCLNILDVRGMDFVVSDVSIDNIAGVTTFNGSSTPGVPAPAALGHLLTRLVGGARQPCSMTLEALVLQDLDGNTTEVEPGSLSLEMLRGDARADGVINIADALVIAQYLVGSRPACTTVVDTICLHAVNAASVAQDGAFDQKTIADTLLIAQYLLGLRDEFYNSVPSP